MNLIEKYGEINKSYYECIRVLRDRINTEIGNKYNMLGTMYLNSDFNDVSKILLTIDSLNENKEMLNKRYSEKISFDNMASMVYLSNELDYMNLPKNEYGMPYRLGLGGK